MFVLRRDGTYVDCHARDPALRVAEHVSREEGPRIMPPALAGCSWTPRAGACHSTEPIVVEHELSSMRHAEARLTQADTDRLQYRPRRHRVEAGHTALARSSPDG